jgi:hypothetical protein
VASGDAKVLYAAMVELTRNGREPSVAELAQHLGWPTARVQRAIAGAGSLHVAALHHRLPSPALVGTSSRDLANLANQEPLRRSDDTVTMKGGEYEPIKRVQVGILDDDPRDRDLSAADKADARRWVRRQVAGARLSADEPEPKRLVDWKAAPRDRGDHCVQEPEHVEPDYHVVRWDEADARAVDRPCDEPEADEYTALADRLVGHFAAPASWEEEILCDKCHLEPFNDVDRLCEKCRQGKNGGRRPKTR